ELFNPLTGTFALTGSMHAPRRGHTATLLANGTVLIAGGENDATGAVWTTAEIFDPATGKFTAAANMVSARAAYGMGCFETASPSRAFANLRATGSTAPQ